MFCDVQFFVGSEEQKILSHVALVAARSAYLRIKIKQVKENRDKQLTKLYGKFYTMLSKLLLN